ncbi:MAG: hypothetical protein Ta2A_08210 [Treponemataceae bacterium]|nr:MAG: hypothetical protein Ta2A_08210 [Treponemataceae bacterium]
MIELYGNRYKVREIEIPGIGLCNISTVSLNSVIMTAAGGYTSERAGKLDEQIYYFVNDNKIDLPNDELEALLIREVA